MFTVNPSYRPSRGERVFADPSGHVWIATRTGEAMVFTCISECRNSSRAIAVDVAEVNAVGDDTLRIWLNDAPRIGMLS